MAAAPESNDTNRKLMWSKPSVQELGNLRDFVRTGNSCGKSSPMSDGVGGCNSEGFKH